MYAEFLEDWLRVWPREQLLIFRNEDYKVSQQEHMHALFNFLGEQGLILALRQVGCLTFEQDTPLRTPETEN